MITKWYKFLVFQNLNGINDLFLLQNTAFMMLEYKLKFIVYESVIDYDTAPSLWERFSLAYTSHSTHQLQTKCTVHHI